MESNEERIGVGHEEIPANRKLNLRFTCPQCGSRDLKLTLLCASYPTSTLDFLEVDPDCFEDSEVHEREPYGEHWSSGNDGWEFECANCGRTPQIEIDGKKRPLWNEEELAAWLIEHCPQEDPDLPENADKEHQE